MRRRVLFHLAVPGIVALAAILAPACGGSPTQPTPPPPPVTYPPIISSLTPNTGSTAGGTAVMIQGSNFATGATVAIGGVQATGVLVQSSTLIAAVTGAHAAGTAEVVVTVGTLSGSLAGGFTYVAPPPNTPPVIRSITAQGTRPNEPSNFADLGEELAVVGSVEDAETPISQLQFAWTSDVGTFVGTGPSATWRAPTTGTAPLTATLTLTVTETVGAGFTNQVSGKVTVDVHNSVKEVSDLSVAFLVDFSISSIPPEQVIRDFYDGCPGKASELGDVQVNRANYIIQSYTISNPTSATIDFKGVCAFRARKGDACVSVPVEWHSLYKPTGLTETTIGVGYLSAVFRNARWYLCDSDWYGNVTHPLRPFIR